MKVTVYENTDELLLVFPWDKVMSEYPVTSISKVSMGSACGSGYENLKLLKKAIKKYKLKRIDSFEFGVKK